MLCYTAEWAGLTAQSSPPDNPCLPHRPGDTPKEGASMAVGGGGLALTAGGSVAAQGRCSPGKTPTVWSVIPPAPPWQGRARGRAPEATTAFQSPILCGPGLRLLICEVGATSVGRDDQGGWRGTRLRSRSLFVPGFYARHPEQRLVSGSPFGQPQETGANLTYSSMRKPER